MAVEMVSSPQSSGAAAGASREGNSLGAEQSTGGERPGSLPSVGGGSRPGSVGNRPPSGASKSGRGGANAPTRSGSGSNINSSSSSNNNNNNIKNQAEAAAEALRRVQASEAGERFPSISSTPRGGEDGEYTTSPEGEGGGGGGGGGSRRRGGKGRRDKARKFDQSLKGFIEGGQGAGEGGGGRKTDRSSKSGDGGGGGGGGGGGAVASSNKAQSPYMQAPSALIARRPGNKEGDADKKKADQRPEAAIRRRHLQMLRGLQDGAKKRVTEELEAKKLQEEERAKLKAKMGVENVSSKIWSVLQEALTPGARGDAEGRKDKEPEKKAEKKEKKDLTPEELEEAKRRKEEVAARNRAILEKNQQFLQKLAEKRKEEEVVLDAVRKKEEALRNKLREKILEQVEKNREENGAIVPAAPQSVDRPLKRETDKEEEKVEVKRSEVEKQIQNRVKRHQDRFACEADEAAWIRKKYGLDADDRIYCIAGGPGAYQGIRDALNERGWKEHREEDSMIFDLKWTVKTTDIAFKALNKDQIVNHFQRNAQVTTKVGLTRNLRSLKWFESVDTDDFFPRSYDLHDPMELFDWVEDFKILAAENLLRKFLRDGRDVTDQQGKALGEGYCDTVQLACLMLDAYIKNCEVDNLDEDPSLEFKLEAAEWTAILGEPCPVFANREFAEAAEAHSVGTGGAWGAGGNPASKRARTIGYRPYASCADRGGGGGTVRKMKTMTDDALRKMCEPVAKRMREVSTQASLNGLDNIWIVKPAGKSRGRDIICANSVNKVLDYIGYGVAGKEMHWVVQKYMENPYLINGRKFDFRQWVMVTDWNPLTVWFYEESYLRFSMSDYTVKDLDNCLIHLCNNSIQKEGEDSERIKKESMWELAEFKKHVMDKFGSLDVWENKILPKMKDISRWALMCAQDMLENRKNSCENYGYDFMLDADCNVWLLEVNASPDMSASTEVTERLTYSVLQDMMKVVIDYRDWSRSKKDERAESCDTGMWGLIHKGDMEVSFPISAFGCKLELQGKEIAIQAKYSGSVPTYTIDGSNRQTRSQKLLEMAAEKAKIEEEKAAQLAAQKKKEAKQRAKERKRREKEREARERAMGAGGGGGGGGGGETEGADCAADNGKMNGAEDDMRPSAWEAGSDEHKDMSDSGNGGVRASADSSSDRQREALVMAQKKALAASADWASMGGMAGANSGVVGLSEKRIGSGSWRGGWASARSAAAAAAAGGSSGGVVARHLGPANASERRVNSGPIHKKVLTASVVTLGGDLF